MSDEQVPDIEELKAQIEIPVEEDIDELKADEKAQDPDVVGELKNLGHQFAETIQTAWNSEERVRVEQEVREGVKSFVDEIDKVIQEVKANPTTAKVKDEAMGAKDQIESTDVGRKAREGIVQGLTWFSQELGNLAEQFSAPEKSPEDIDDQPAEES